MILALDQTTTRRIVDPEGVQDRDEKPILDKEQDAHRHRTLSLSPDTNGADGTLRARLDAIGYATLAAYLAAATGPRVTPDGELQPKLSATPGPSGNDDTTGSSKPPGRCCPAQPCRARAG